MIVATSKLTITTTAATNTNKSRCGKAVPSLIIVGTVITAAIVTAPRTPVNPDVTAILNEGFVSFVLRYNAT